MTKPNESAGSRIKPASTLIAEYCLGQTTARMPLVEWCGVDGNIFSVIGTASNAWKRVDSKVTERIRKMSVIAMSGKSEDPELARIAKALKESDDGYNEILGAMMQLTDGEEDDDLGGLEKDFPDEDEDEDEG